MGSLGNPKEAQMGSFSSPAAKWNPTPPPLSLLQLTHLGLPHSWRGRTTATSLSLRQVAPGHRVLEHTHTWVSGAASLQGLLPGHTHSHIRAPHELWRRAPNRHLQEPVALLVCKEHREVQLWKRLKKRTDAVTS